MYVIIIYIIVCHNTTEVGSNVIRPMVPNPIYEGMAIYEEIPGRCNVKSLPKHTNEREEGYVSISTTGSVLNRDFTTIENHIQVRIS